MKVMDEKYLSMFEGFEDMGVNVSQYRTYADVSSIDYASRIYDDGLRDHIMPELTKYITDLAERATAEIKSKDPKKLSIAETLELLKKGLKPYFYDQRSCSLTELTLDNEDRAENIKWIHPKMAEKINERYREIEALEEDLEDYTVKVEAKIKDLRSRISDIEEKGTDLLI